MIKKSTVIKCILLSVAIFAAFWAFIYVSFHIAFRAGTAFWDDHPFLTRSLSKDKKLIAKALEKKYGEEFTVVSFEDGGGGPFQTSMGTCIASDYFWYSALCMRNSDGVYFKTNARFPIMSSITDTAEIRYTTFVQVLVAREIENALSDELRKVCGDFVIYTHIDKELFDSGILSADEATAENFAAALQREKEERGDNSSSNTRSDVSIYIVIPEETAPENNELYAALGAVTEKFYTMYVSVECYFADAKTLEECRTLADDKADLRGSKISSVLHDPVSSAFYYKPDEGLVQTHISGEPVN